MIPVSTYPHPPNYINSVRRPGHTFLSRNPNPSSSQFRAHSYWSRVHQYLYDCYSGICSYCSSWMPRASDITQDNHSSVDHFFPKSSFPSLAYEWENFRIARHDINENKKDDIFVLDPSFIQDGWFEIDFVTCRIKAALNLNGILSARIRHTILILKLNEPPFIDERVDVIGYYAHDKWSIGFIQGLYPFIARELLRQDIEATLKDALKSVHPVPV